MAIRSPTAQAHTRQGVSARLPGCPTGRHAVDSQLPAGEPPNIVNWLAAAHHDASRMRRLGECHGGRRNPRYSQPSRLVAVRVPVDERPGIAEPARFRLRRDDLLARRAGPPMRLLPAQVLLAIRGRRDDRGPAAARHRRRDRGQLHRHPWRCLVGFAFTELLGFKLLPRLKNIGAIQLYALPGQPTRTARPTISGIPGRNRTPRYS